MIEEETTAKGNESEITNLLNTIQTARIEQFVEEQPEQLASYGLNNSKLTVKLTTLKANEPLTLFIGGKSEHGFYAKTLSKKNIFVIEDGRLAEEGTHEELRARNGLYSSLCAKQSLD